MGFAPTWLRQVSPLWHDHFNHCSDPRSPPAPTCQHSVFHRPDALPTAQSTVSKHWSYVNSTVHRI